MPSVILQKVNLMWRVLVAKMVDRNANQSRLREMQAWRTGPNSMGLLRWVGLARLIQQKFMVVAGFEPATYGRKATGQTTWTNAFFWFECLLNSDLLHWFSALQFSPKCDGGGWIWTCNLWKKTHATQPPELTCFSDLSGRPYYLLELSVALQFFFFLVLTLQHQLITTYSNTTSTKSSTNAITSTVFKKKKQQQQHQRDIFIKSEAHQSCWQ